jgi:hypothetical protein
MRTGLRLIRVGLAAIGALIVAVPHGGFVGIGAAQGDSSDFRTPLSKAIEAAEQVFAEVMKKIMQAMPGNWVGQETPKSDFARANCENSRQVLSRMAVKLSLVPLSQ